MTDTQETQGKAKATGENVVVGSGDEAITLAEFESTLSYTIPSEGVREEMKHRAGEKVNKTFVYGQVETEEQAKAVMAARDMSVIDYVNDTLKSNARSSCYQTTAALYKESKVTAEQIQERAIKDLIRVGVPEDVARATVLGAVESAQG